MKGIIFSNKAKRNAKGFMFSIEALCAVSIILLALGIFAYSTTTNETKTNNTQIKLQAEKQMVLYFNRTADAQNGTAKEQYCTKIVTYEAGSLPIKTTCEGTT